jgi:hypothetical protein
MTATYPTSVRSYTNKVDLQDAITASDVNNAYEEITAVENALGAGILSSTWTGSFSQVTTSASVNARLSNIERGIIGDTHTQYFKKTGDSITISNPAFNGFVLTGNINQTANLAYIRTYGTTGSNGIGLIVGPDGTCALGGALNVAGPVNLNNSSIRMALTGAPGGSTYAYAVTNTSTNYVYYLGSIASTEKVKRSIKDTVPATVSTLIDEVRPVTFQYKEECVRSTAEADRVRFGFIAEQLESVGLSDAVDRDDNGNPVDIDTRQLIGILWAEVQDLRKRVARLEAV